MSNIFKKFLNLQRKKLFTSINLVFYFAWNTEVSPNYLAGRVLQEWTVLTEFDATCPEELGGNCVRRISLPGNLMKLTCSEQYLFTFFMTFGYGIFHDIDIW